MHGHRLLIIDELGKTYLPRNKLAKLLAIGNPITWRPLYQTHDVQTPCRAVFVFPSATVPEHLRKMDEFVRRVHHLRLPRTVPEWSWTCGGDTVEWRDRTAENARAANSLLTHAWRRSVDGNFIL